MPKYTRQLKFRTTEQLADLISSLAARKRMTISNLLEKIIIESITNGFEDALTNQELEIVKLRNAEKQTNALKYIRSKSAERIMFIHNIKKQFYLFTLNKKDVNKEEMIRNMELNEKIALTNDWVEEAEKIRFFLDSIKSQNYELNHETKQIEGVKK